MNIDLKVKIFFMFGLLQRYGRAEIQAVNYVELQLFSQNHVMLDLSYSQELLLENRSIVTEPFICKIEVGSFEEEFNGNLHW